jgi:predicted phosphohydrolase
MNFQIASDLHIECQDTIPDPLSLITPSADILILAGDIGSIYKLNQLRLFLTKLCGYFKIVVYILGNHEYYRTKECVSHKQDSMKNLYKKFVYLEKIIDNFYVLNRSSLQIGNVCIVGCTLWSKPKIKIPQYIVRIQEMNNKTYTKKYKEDLNYIETMIKYCDDKKLKLIVVTHYCPTYSIIPEKKLKEKYISLYASNLDYLLTKEKVHTWVCGHIHSNFDIISNNGTHVVGNQLGKPRDDVKKYKKNFVITI